MRSGGAGGSIPHQDSAEVWCLPFCNVDIHEGKFDGINKYQKHFYLHYGGIGKESAGHSHDKFFVF